MLGRARPTNTTSPSSSGPDRSPIQSHDMTPTLRLQGTLTPHCTTDLHILPHRWPEESWGKTKTLGRGCAAAGAPARHSGLLCILNTAWI